MVLGLLASGGAALAATSPLDGPRLAVVRFSAESLRLDLQTMDQTGALPLRLFGGGLYTRPLPFPLFRLSWSPDGSLIAFTGLVGSFQRVPRSLRIFVVGSDGGDPRVLPGTRGGFAPVFSPGGDTVAFSRTRYWRGPAGRGGQGALGSSTSAWLVDIAGGAPRRITPWRIGLSLEPDSFSPDGRTLLLTRYIGARQPEVVAMPIDGGGSTVLSRRAAEPVFSPDGTRIAFLRTRPLRGRDLFSETTDLLTMNSDGTGLRRLTRTPAHLEAYPRWDPSGERLVFTRWRRTPNEFAEFGFGNAVLQANADGTCMREVLRLPATALYGAIWQPGPGRGAGRIAC